MFYLARIVIIVLLIGSVWSQEHEPFGPPRFGLREQSRAARFIGLIPEEPLFPPRFGFGFLETMRESYCRRFCVSPFNSTFIQNLMCFARCPDLALLQSSSTVTPSTGPTAAPTRAPAAPAPAPAPAPANAG